MHGGVGPHTSTRAPASPPWGCGRGRTWENVLARRRCRVGDSAPLGLGFFQAAAAPVLLPRDAILALEASRALPLNAAGSPRTLRAHAAL